MAEQKVYEGRADLNIKPFLDALTKMETQSKVTADNLTKIFHSLDAAINQSLAGVQATVHTVAANVTAVGRAVAQANGAVQQGQGAVKAIQAQGQAAQRASAENTRAAQLEASARKLVNEQQLVELKRRLRAEEELIKDAAQSRNINIKKGNQRDVEEIAIAARREMGLLQEKIREQQAIQDRARRVQAVLAEREARALRSGAGTAGLPSAAAYDQVNAAAQRAAATEQSLQRQLTTVMQTEAATRTKLGVEPWEKMSDAQLKFLRENGAFNQRFRAGLEQSRRELKRVEDSLNSIYRAGSQLIQLGSELTLVGGLLGTLGFNLAENAGEFDFWATRVAASAKTAQARTGEALDATIIKSENFKARILQIGGDVGILQPEEIAKGWYLYQSALGSAIRTTEDMVLHQSNVNLMMRASVITNTDHATVIRGVTQAMAEFGLSAQELPYALAVMQNVTQVTQAEFSDMLQAFKLAGPQAKRLGLDIADVAATFGLLSNAGIRGTQAGRLFASGMTNLVRPTNQMREALQDLFVTQRGLTGTWEQFLYKNGQFVGLFDTLNERGEVLNRGALRQFHEATKSMSAAQREFYLASIFGKDAGKVWSTLIAEYSKAQQEAEAAGETGINSFERMAQAMKDPQEQLKVFGDQWKDVSGSIKVQMGAALFVLEELRQQLGAIVAHNLIPFIKTLGELAKSFMAWAKEHPEVANGLVKVAIVVAALSVTIGPLLILLGFLIQGFGSMGTALASLKLIGSGVAGLFTGLKAAAVALVPAVGGITIPIWAVIAALALLYLAWRNNWFGMRDALGEVVAALGVSLAALTKLLGGVITLLTGLFTNNDELIRQGGREVAEAIIEAFILIPQQMDKILAGVLLRFLSWAGQLTVSMRIWGYNMIVALANGMIDAARVAVAAAYAIAEALSRPFRSKSPPQYGPLKDITVWGRNIVQALADGMNSADFDAIFTVADQVAEALKRNIEAGLTTPSTYAASMQQATGLVREMLEIIRGGGSVNEDFFSSLRGGLGEWYDDIVKIALAYQDVYANERQLKIEQDKLNVLREQRKEMDAQNRARQDAFDTYLKGSRPDSFQNNEANLVDPTTEEGRAKIEQMRRTLSAQEFQQWLQWQQRMWQDRADAEDRSLKAQEEAQQQVVDTYSAQVEAAKKQYELYRSMYEYAVRLYNLAEEQKQLEEQAAAADAAKTDNTGTPEQVKQFLGEIAGAVGQDQAVLDEGLLRERAGGDDIATLGDASEQREREEKRLDELERLNRRKRAEFEMALINATSEEERNNIRQQKDAWDAAYRQEKVRLQERIQMAQEVQEAAKRMADASMAGRVAEQEAKFYEEIKQLLGEQTDAIEDANALKAHAGDLDQAAIVAREQLRDEERKLRDLQAYGDQKKLEFEERIRQAASDPEKLRRIEEEQAAWDTAYKKALEAQQLRVELARRAQQDIGDETRALDGAAGAGGFDAPDFGEPPEGLGDQILDKMPWLNDDGSINWDFLGLGENSPTGLRPTELQSITLFDDLKRALTFLGDETIPVREKIELLGKSINEFLVGKWVDLVWPTAREDIENALRPAKDVWLEWTTGYAADFVALFGSEAPKQWTVFKAVWNNLWGNETLGSWETGYVGPFKTIWKSLWSNDTIGGWKSIHAEPFQKDWATTWAIETLGGWREEHGRTFVDDWATFWGTTVPTHWGTFKTLWDTYWTTDIKGWWEQNFSSEFSRAWSLYWSAQSVWWKENFGTPLETSWKNLWSGLKLGWEGFKLWFKSGDDGWDKLWSGLKATWDAFWEPTRKDWSTVVNTINSVLSPIILFVKALSLIKFPAIPSWLGGGGQEETPKGSGGGSGGGYAQGLMAVPYNNFQAVLHAGERVLTAREAAFYNSLEGAMAQMSALLARAGSLQTAGPGGGKVINIHVANLDATNPDEGRAFLSRLAFLS